MSWQDDPVTETPNEATANEWDESAEGWDGDEATRAYAAGAFASLCTLLEPRSLTGMRVLDFGCGTGLLTEQLVAAGAAHVCAVDSSPAMLAVLDDKIVDQAWSSVISSQAVPVDPDAFDLVVCSSVMAFIDDYEATVVTLVQLLSPDGRFVQWDWERVDDDPHGLSRSEISTALVEAGLEDVSVEIGFEVEAHGQTMRPLMGVGQRAAS